MILDARRAFQAGVQIQADRSANKVRESRKGRLQIDGAKAAGQKPGPGRDDACKA